MDIFITGATGALGRPTVRLLVEHGHQVRGLARSDANVARLHELGAAPVRADLFDATALTKAAAGCQAILHLATKIPPMSQIGRRSAWMETDHIRREGTRAVVEAARAAQVATVIYPSICFAYPDSGAAWIDATTCEPIISGYYQSTFDAEAAVQGFTASGGQGSRDATGRGIVLRMGFFYGPESPQSRAQLRYARWGIATVPGRPAAYHPFIWIDDAARAVVAALERAPAGIFDIVEDEPATTEEIAQALAQAVGRRRIFMLPEFMARLTIGREITAVMSRSQRVSNRRFKDATDWAPQMTNIRAGWRQVAAATT
jgi:nucleoside-diphosphate-sugar epimerase